MIKMIENINCIVRKERKKERKKENKQTEVNKQY